MTNIKTQKMIYLYSFISCFIVACVYAIIIKFFARPIIWISIVGTGTGLVLSGVLLQEHHKKFYYEGSTRSETVGTLIKIAYWILYTVGGMFACAVLCYYKSIKISARILETSSVVLIRNLYSVLAPIFSAVFILLYIALWSWTVILVLSCTNIEQP